MKFLSVLALLVVSVSSIAAQNGNINPRPQEKLAVQVTLILNLLIFIPLQVS